MMKQRLLAFDFDGTLTTCDTLLAFIRYVCGARAMYWGFLLHAPLLVLMKLHLYDNGRMKERIITYFFGGMEEERFDRYCADFARSHRHLLRPQTMNVMRAEADGGHRIVVVSASVDRWVRPFFTGIVTKDGDCGLPVTVIGTQVEVVDGRLTGRFATPNCYGSEKVRRLLEAFPDRKNYYLMAFGDSRGDRELFHEADEKFKIQAMFSKVVRE